MYDFSYDLENLLREGFEIKLGYHRGRAILQRAELVISHPRIGEIRLTGDTPISALDRMMFLIGHQKNSITIRTGYDEGLGELDSLATSVGRDEYVELELFADDGLIYVSHQRGTDGPVLGRGKDRLVDAVRSARYEGTTDG